jgi:predicted dehydrogenase
MKFLIAGLGSIGRRHLHNLFTLGEQDIILYRTHRSTLPDVDLPDFPVETSLQAALAHQPDAVIVSNPTSLHLEVAIPAAQAGCHILLEKPVSHNLVQVNTLVKLVQQTGSRILVGYHFRFHPGLIKINQLLQEGVIGHPLSTRAHWGEYLPGWHPWEDYRLGYSARSDLGGGVILTLSHPLDYLGWMFGKVESVWAFTDKLGDLELNVEDTAEIILQFKQQVIASVHLDYNQRPPAHHLEIIGSRGNIRWDNHDGAVQLYIANEAQTSKPESSQWQIFPVDSLLNQDKPFERNDLFIAEMRHFINVVKGTEQPVCTLADGIRALELSLVAIRSAGLKRKLQLN